MVRRPVRRGGASRTARAAVALCAAVAVAGIAGCEDEADAPSVEDDSPPAAREGTPAADALADAAWYGRSATELAAQLERAIAQARAAEGTAEGVLAARRAAQLARALAVRGDEEALERGRQSLRRATRKAQLEGVCGAMLELARLEARDAARLSEAYVVAHRIRRRYAEQPEHRRCVREARRMTAMLDAHRPTDERLASLGGAGAGEGEARHAADVRAWSTGRSVGGARSGLRTLSQLALYGRGEKGGASGRPSAVRVVLELDGVVLFDRGEIEAEGSQPRRLYLDLHETRVGEGVARSETLDAAGLRRVRTGQPRKRETRVVFELEPDAEYQLFFLSDPFRIVADFRSAGGLARTGATSDAGPVVVLDPGHGGDDEGARHDGLVESHLALDLARRVRGELERRMPRARVLLTRDRDAFVSLEQRTAMANAVGADLFVSIHLNASDAPVDHGGVATFVLDTNEDAQALQLAARENATTIEEVTGLQRLLATLHRRDQVTSASRLARRVQRETLARARKLLPELTDRGVKEAMFYVLVGARMPAVLVEASFLTHPEEARQLRTERYRSALAAGIAAGILRHVEAMSSDR